MTEPFVNCEVDRTKSKWLANVFREFGKPKTTLRSLFYFALSRAEPDYPICGGFVGEIRVTRLYHESDGLKLSKWVGKAREMGFVPKDAILEEVPGEHIFINPSEEDAEQKIELWLNKSALNPLLLPICKKLGVNLVSVQSRPTNMAINALLERARNNAISISCLSDLSSSDFLFTEDLTQSVLDTVKGRDQPSIRIEKMGMTPQQVVDFRIPMVPGKKAEKHIQDRYKKYLKPYGLEPKRMAELDALEVYYSRGISGFVEDKLSESFLEMKK
jgi:hypothetical protein